MEVYKLYYLILLAFSYDELFGVKRWRNDSPFVKEYTKVDNQIFAILIFSCLLLWPFFVAKRYELFGYAGEVATSDMGKFTADDLL
jgi:hypothetical protein